MRSHIAILKPKYLNLILSGPKRLECRLTRLACPPFRRVAPAEKVLLKRSGGPVRGQAIVRQTLFLDDLTPDRIDAIRREYGEQIMADPDFWQARTDCTYCSLIWLENVRPIKPYPLKRKGLQAWIICEDDCPLERTTVQALNMK